MVLLITFLLLTVDYAGAGLFHTGLMIEDAFFPIDIVELIYDDTQDLVWADFTTLQRHNWSDVSDWAEGIDGIYFWNGDPFDFSGGWRLPTVDEFLSLWSVGLSNWLSAFHFLFPDQYWTSTQISDTGVGLFAMESGTWRVENPDFSYGYGIAVRDVVNNSQVPEPSSLILLALGFLSLFGFIRCRGISGRT